MDTIDHIAEMNDPRRMRIIGVELKMLAPTGQQTELAVFGCGLIVPNPRGDPTSWGRYRFPVTLHTNVGDFNLQGDTQ